MKLCCGYKIGRFEGTIDARLMVASEAQKLQRGDRIMFVSQGGGVLRQGGGVLQCRVSGKPKTWKTRPGHVRVPVKYGLYENSYVESYGGLDDAVTVGCGLPVVVEV
jgi:hypothetical protein